MIRNSIRDWMFAGVETSSKEVLFQSTEHQTIAIDCYSRVLTTASNIEYCSVNHMPNFILYICKKKRNKIN